MSDATITSHPQAVEETPTMVLRWIERDQPKVFGMEQFPSSNRVLQQQWKLREAPSMALDSYKVVTPWRFEWRDVVFDPHGGP